jgi:hypothetical protein
VSGWWRRNAWAAPVAVVALALTGGPGAKSWYDTYRGSTPLEAVHPGGDGWAGYGGGRLHLASIRQIRPTDLSGTAAALPAGTTAWQATLDVALSAPGSLDGCGLFLRGVSGHLYGADSTELRWKVRGASLSCADYDDESATAYRVAPVFLLAAGDAPAAVVIRQATKLPRYVELPVRAG